MVRYLETALLISEQLSVTVNNAIWDVCGGAADVRDGHAVLLHARVQVHDLAGRSSKDHRALVEQDPVGEEPARRVTVAQELVGGHSAEQGEGPLHAGDDVHELQDDDRSVHGIAGRHAASQHDDDALRCRHDGRQLQHDWHGRPRPTPAAAQPGRLRRGRRGRE